MTVSILLFLFALTILWIGSGLAVSSVTRLAQSMRMSSFIVSFVVLGLFTSITEIMVGFNAYLDNKPEIFVGNLIGSSVVVFLMIVPLLAILGNGVQLNHSFSFRSLIIALVVIGMPALLALDASISNIDAVFCIVSYLFFFFTQHVSNKSAKRVFRLKLTNRKLYRYLIQIAIAVGFVFWGSSILVDQTIVLATGFGISPFIISLLLVSIGTNIPELSIVVRAVLLKKNNVAFGNYVGSASMNTLELGVLSLISLSPIATGGSRLALMVFLIGLLLIAVYARSRNTISRTEGAILFSSYILFVGIELVSTHLM